MTQLILPPQIEFPTELAKTQMRRTVVTSLALEETRTALPVLN